MKGRKGRLGLLTAVWAAALLLATAGSIQAEDAFTILDQLGKNYVGLEIEGLKSVVGKVAVSTLPDADITVYWSREKGMKVKVEGGGPMAAAARPMIEGFLFWAGLGMERFKERRGDLVPEKVVGKAEAATLNGKKVTRLTFTPKKGQVIGFDKMVMMVDTKNWLLRQNKSISGGEETVTDVSYEDILPCKVVMTAGQMKTEIQNTYVKKGRAKILSKQKIKMEAPEIPDEMKEFVITYSDVKINAEIPEEIFEEPKTDKGPKPKESAAELMAQVKEAMEQGDMETAKSKLLQIITHYPDDPMTPGAKTMLEQLP